ncbi:hypothetical protein VII00023_15816, partial [Vibrio ichthyoenteri ATCC 700023]
MQRTAFVRLEWHFSFFIPLGGDESKFHPIYVA